MVDNITARFNEIYASTADSTLAYIAAKCPDIDDMNDIFQETYMELYRVLSAKGADYIENGEAFAIKLAKQKIYRYYGRFNKIRADISLSVLTPSDEKEVLNNDLEENPEDIVCTEELVDKIDQFLKKKPQDIRKIFFLRFSMDLSISEIAELMGTKESRVKNKLYRTIKEIRTIYAEEGEAFERE